MKWREVRCCDWNFWHCSGVSLMSFIPTTSFLVIELSSYKSHLFPLNMIHAEEMICRIFFISLCLSHWGKISKKTETYSAVKHSIQTIVGILQFHQLPSTAVFPPELASIDFLKLIFCISSTSLKEVVPSSLLADIWKLPQMHRSAPSLGKPSANMSSRSNILLLAHLARNALLFSPRGDWSPLLSLRAGEWRGIRDVRCVLDRRLQSGTHRSGRRCVGKRKKKMGGVSSQSCRWSCPV